MRKTGDSPQPVAHVLLALGNIVEKDGTPIVASSDVSSPRSLTDSVGCFESTDSNPNEITSYPMNQR